MDFRCPGGSWALKCLHGDKQVCGAPLCPGGHSSNTSSTCSRRMARRSMSRSSSRSISVVAVVAGFSSSSSSSSEDGEESRCASEVSKATGSLGLHEVRGVQTEYEVETLPPVNRSSKRQNDRISVTSQAQKHLHERLQKLKQVQAERMQRKRQSKKAITQDNMPGLLRL
eukprot:TRINITY_DN23222_c0_g1_i3.p1 TRINITY_DN23222_c0_g1~~TRINITY_DN23222_c0_g1_i3.p1  ORF type:complete len:170 (-),score=19.78 TRINITY_DN23222_c0_g1_i3:334-843(-)